jgi:hypothetical protein
MHFGGCDVHSDDVQPESTADGSESTEERYGNTLNRESNWNTAQLTLLLCAVALMYSPAREDG